MLKQNIPWMLSTTLQMPEGASVCEISEDWYYNIFDSVPPLTIGEGFFVCGEPYSQTIINSKYYLTYGLFVRVREDEVCRYFFLGEITVIDIPNILSIIHKRIYE